MSPQAHINKLKLQYDALVVSLCLAEGSYKRASIRAEIQRNTIRQLRYEAYII